jgi:uncharacterized protein YndB with AHSA1/START domain
MTARSTVHSTFTLDRVFNAAPARVYRAFADKDAKEQWFHGPDDWELDEHEMDFRVGGTETNAGGPAGGPVHKFDARYHEIVADERIVYTYDMFVGGTQLSTSLATFEFAPEGDRTRLTVTEQGVYYDGHEDPKVREEGTRLLLDAVAHAVESANSPA